MDEEDGERMEYKRPPHSRFHRTRRRLRSRVRDRGRPTAGFVTAELRNFLSCAFENLAQGRGLWAPRSVAENAATVQAV
jgi:hypothetical protein